MTKMQRAEQLRRALQMFAQTLGDGAAMEVATVFPAWEAGRAYSASEIVTYGVNGVGDPQLYRVLQGHTSQADWTPDAAASLFAAVGQTEDGYPEWSQPTGAADAYQTGDVVSHGGVLYVSTADGNVWAPGTYGWSEYEVSAE